MTGNNNKYSLKNADTDQFCYKILHETPHALKNILLILLPRSRAKREKYFQNLLSQHKEIWK